MATEIERLRRRTTRLGAIVVAGSGSENVNRAVDGVLDDEELSRVLAQVEVTFSNSMIEAFWRSLKHSWL
jgi:putative transposase